MKTLAETWAEPREVDDVDVAFPARVDHLLPPYDQIPHAFKGWGADPWVNLVERWFHRGLPAAPVFREGIDRTKALRHLRCCMGSFQPRHGHKIAGVAYLLSLWCESPEIPEPEGGR